MTTRTITAVSALLLALFLTITPTHAQRVEIFINDGWRFSSEDCPESALPDFDDSGWTEVNIPHSWNSDAYVVKDYRKGPAWYRKTLPVAERKAGESTFLRMEGASKSAEVYVNGKFAGCHEGGYTGALFDLSEMLEYGKPNTIAIRVDNSREDITPISGDFTFFGGIYRDLSLVTIPALRFNPDTEFGADGFFVKVPEVSEEKGRVIVSAQIFNGSPERRRIRLVHNLYAPEGVLLCSGGKTVTLNSGESLDFENELPEVNHPLLWSPETPWLYRLESLITDARSGEVLDRMEHYTAFRWFRFDPQEGFFLNGKPYKLRGMCRHQDQKPIGPALGDEMHRRDFKLIKELGANFIRISHYPQDEAFIEMCDRMGMLVWEEIPVIDIVPDNKAFADNCEKNLREMIRQHRNHPSVITWGYMNEILLVTLRTYSVENGLDQALERTLNLAKRLEAALDEEDTGRASCMAFHSSNAYNEYGFGDITDIVGWNIYAGWYGGDLSGFEDFTSYQQQNYPSNPLIVSEYGAGSDRRIHSVSPRPFDFSTEYQQEYVEHYLPVIENTPYICGGSYWNFIDFGSAKRDESMPRINNKGLVYSDRTPKDVYYYYKASWRDDVPVLRIASRDWNPRVAVQEGDAPVYMPVKVYTNLPEVELFADGVSLGRRKVENSHAVFDVPFSGERTYLQAEGTWQGEKVLDGISVDVRLVPSSLKAFPTGLELGVNVGSDCSFTSAESGFSWVPDREYVPGGWGYIGGIPVSTQTEVKLTADDPLYQTMREDISAYRFDVPEGRYEIELLLCDRHGSAEGTAYLLGMGDGDDLGDINCFDIVINGRTVQPAYIAEDGCRAVKKRYVAEAQDGRIEVSFNAINGKTHLSGIKIRKL